jgi:SpoVK/Ycf46/Vps4 family AAA+-type ATPase
MWIVKKLFDHKRCTVALLVVWMIAFYCLSHQQQQHHLLLHQVFVLTFQALTASKRSSGASVQFQNLVSTLKFKSLQTDLRKSGYKSGFCVLLYGAPGTGKTETVLQLAKSTGRAIVKVDISSIRDKFVGETEKNISEVFKSYRALCKQSELTPILLFNEADALFNKRMNVKQSVDQMNNAMQNILLEELENFDGILFATTNLALHMDKAFERRFLYKINFMNPTDEARRSIWQVHFPELEPVLLEKIAGEFHLSGGQIENVVRKAKLQSLLYKEPINFDSLKKFCNEETLENSNELKQIGFKRD